MYFKEEGKGEGKDESEGTGTGTGETAAVAEMKFEVAVKSEATATSGTGSSSSQGPKQQSKQSSPPSGVPPLMPIRELNTRANYERSTLFHQQERQV